MNECSSCARWILARRTVYADGSEIDHEKASEGKGRCEVLGVETAPDFGCNKHEPAPEGFAHFTVEQKVGAPWQHSHAGPCPDCSGAGSENDHSCHRCAGTGKVRHYDDGFVGEEQTRLHPKEREFAAKPRCVGCAGVLDPSWKACPLCGKPTEAPAATEQVVDTSLGP